MIALLVIAIPDGGRYSVVLNGGYKRNTPHLGYEDPLFYAKLHVLCPRYDLCLGPLIVSSTLELDLVYLCNLL